MKSVPDSSSIYIISPSSPVRSPGSLERAQQRLAALGFQATIDPGAYAAYQRFAGTDRQRLAALERALLQPAPFVLASRGGYGMNRLLPLINWPTVARSGKYFIGHSDFTAFNMALYAQTGAMSYAGPCAAFDFGEAEPNQEMAQSFARTLKGEQKDISFTARPLRSVARLTQVDGVLWGGNLAMLCSLVGTPYLPQVDGGILFLEDVSEHPYRIERMLIQLHLAGILQRQKAILLGDFTDYRLGAADRGYSIKSTWSWLAHHVTTPAFLGFPYGHVPRKYTVPVGVPVQLRIKDSQAQLSWS